MVTPFWNFQSTQALLTVVFVLFWKRNELRSIWTFRKQKNGGMGELLLSSSFLIFQTGPELSLTSWYQEWLSESSLSHLQEGFSAPIATPWSPPNGGVVIPLAFYRLTIAPKRGAHFQPNNFQSLHKDSYSSYFLIPNNFCIETFKKYLLGKWLNTWRTSIYFCLLCFKNLEVLLWPSWKWRAS